MSRVLFLVARDEALARSQEAPVTKNALGGQLGPYSSPSLVSARRGVTKAYPRFLRPRRGAARSAQMTRTVNGRVTQALVSFAPLAFKLFYAARHNAVLRRSPFFRPRKNVSLSLPALLPAFR